MPANELCHIYQTADKPQGNPRRSRRFEIQFNCHRALSMFQKTKPGDNFAFMIADKDVKFHRLSKLDFLGSHYHKAGTATYMVEITYRKNDLNDKASDAELTGKIIEGLQKNRFYRQQ